MSHPFVDSPACTQPGAERAVAALAASQHSAFGRRRPPRSGSPRRWSRRACGLEPCFARAGRPRPRGVTARPAPGDQGSDGRQDLAAARHRLTIAGDGSARIGLGRLRTSGGSTSRCQRRLAVTFGAGCRRSTALPCSTGASGSSVDGIPCTNIARTLCDLGAVVLARQGRASARRRAAPRRERAVDPRDACLGSIAQGRAAQRRCDACSTCLTVPVPLPDSWFERFVERLLVQLGGASTRASAQGVRDRRQLESRTSTSRGQRSALAVEPSGAQGPRRRPKPASRPCA